MPTTDMTPSPALRVIGNMKDTLAGRAVALLVADGSNGATITALSKALVEAGAKTRLVALTIGPVQLADGATLAGDQQLAGTPSVLFDAIAVVLSEAGAQRLSREASAIDFVRDAFGHLKAIAVDDGGRQLLANALVATDAGVVDAADPAAFVAAAKTRQWDREAQVRTQP